MWALPLQEPWTNDPGVGSVTTMQTGALTIDELMDHFAADNKYWASDIHGNNLAAPIRHVLHEVNAVLGGQSPLLCVGGVLVDHTPPPEGPATRSDYPDMYFMDIVTPQLLVSAWGRIRGPEKALDRELTQTVGLKWLAGVEVNLRPGELRGDGEVANHHEVTLKFTNGSTFELPNNEWLSDEGAERMERLLPRLYAML